MGHYFLGNLCNIKFPNTPQPCFKPILFYTCFFINAPNQFTPRFNLHPLNFGSTPFGWFISTYLIIFYWEYHFRIMPFSFMPISSVITPAHKIRSWCCADTDIVTYILSNINTWCRKNLSNK